MTLVVLHLLYRSYLPSCRGSDSIVHLVNTWWIRLFINRIRDPALPSLQRHHKVFSKQPRFLNYTKTPNLTLYSRWPLSVSYRWTVDTFCQDMAGHWFFLRKLHFIHSQITHLYSLVPSVGVVACTWEKDRRTYFTGWAQDYHLYGVRKELTNHTHMSKYLIF
ncbi:hypothetical protein EDC01DRAFT_43981 [Geopyxis carbonaria]|nr:hypothetical protein EDC01DRAFT_43981 [Geopyxis carbonaria]